MGNKATIGQRTVAGVTADLKARNCLLCTLGKEEKRMENGLIEAAAAAKMVPRFHDIFDGITDALGRPVDLEGNVYTSFKDPEWSDEKKCIDPLTILHHIEDETHEGILAYQRELEKKAKGLWTAEDEKSRKITRELWVLRDWHHVWKQPDVQRGLRTCAKLLQGAPKTCAKAMAIVSADSDIPKEILGDVLVVDWPLPDRDEIAQILSETLQNIPEDKRKGAAPNGVWDKAVDAAVGLTAKEAENCYAKSLVLTSRDEGVPRIDPGLVAANKKAIIAAEKYLEWWDPLPEGLDAVGGLANVKEFSMEVAATFTAKARAEGVLPMKGMLLVGQAGCGKTLIARCVPTALGVPLLRLDVGALQSKWHGESQQNIRHALKLAAAMAPCVMLLDEVEKALATSDVDTVSKDTLGVILTFAQEQRGGVFIIATANDISALPAALLRKGRLDEVWYVDLPNEDEREEVLRAAVKSAGREPGDYDLAAVVTFCNGFSGAEIASLVETGKRKALVQGRKMVTEDMIRAAKELVPQSTTQADTIKALREQAQRLHWKLASAPAKKKADKPSVSVKELDL